MATWESGRSRDEDELVSIKSRPTRKSPVTVRALTGGMPEIAALLGAWHQAGLDPAAVEPVAEAADRLGAIAMERAALTDEQAVMGSIAERVAAGGLTFAEAVRELHDAEAANERGQGNITKADSRGDRLYNAAQAEIVRLAAERLNDQASELVGIVEAEHDPLMAEVEKLARVLAGIPDAAVELHAGLTDAERAAMSDWSKIQAAVDAAGRKEAAAFAKLGELGRRRGALIRVGDALEAVGVTRPSGLTNTSVYELAGMLPVWVAA